MNARATSAQAPVTPDDLPEKVARIGEARKSLGHAAVAEANDTSAQPSKAGRVHVDAESDRGAESSRAAGSATPWLAGTAPLPGGGDLPHRHRSEGSALLARNVERQHYDRRVAAAEGSVSDQIRELEAAIEARDRRIAEGMSSLNRQVRGAIPRPQTAMAAAGAVAAGLVGIAGARHYLNRPKPRTVRERMQDALHALADRDGRTSQREREVELVEARPAFPWLGIIPLAWPLLPARWRTVVSPATASALLGFVGNRLGRRRQPKYKVRRR